MAAIFNDGKISFCDRWTDMVKKINLIRQYELYGRLSMLKSQLGCICKMAELSLDDSEFSSATARFFVDVLQNQLVNAKEIEQLSNNAEQNDH